MNLLLGGSVKLREASSDCQLRHLSVLSIRVEQLGSHWTDFYETSYLIFFRRYFRERTSFTQM